jgi:mannose-6-phosphate isomerase-like protein (cupin superfamily)
MRELLARIDDPARWIKGEPPIEGYVHFRPGARFAPRHGGFFRMLGGTGFPMHRHEEPELTFVLSGRLRDDKGELYDPGDVLDMPAGSSHALHVPDETPALVAVLGGRIAVTGG